MSAREIFSFRNSYFTASVGVAVTLFGAGARTDAGAGSHALGQSQLGVGACPSRGERLAWVCRPG